MCERKTLISWLLHVPQPGLACNPGMCPHWKLNQWPFVLQDDAKLSHTSQGSIFIVIFFSSSSLFGSFSKWLYHIFCSLKIFSRVFFFFVFFEMWWIIVTVCISALISEIFVNLFLQSIFSAGCNSQYIFLECLVIFYYVLIYYWKIICKNDFKPSKTVPSCREYIH